jgi:hypothetical protein
LSEVVAEEDVGGGGGGFVAVVAVNKVPAVQLLFGLMEVVACNVECCC